MRFLNRLQFWFFLIGLLLILWFLGGKYTIIGKTFYFEDWYYDPVIHECLEKDTLYVENDLGGYQKEQSMIEIGDCVKWQNINTGEVYTREDVDNDLSHKLRPILLVSLGFFVLWGILLVVSFFIRLVKRKK